MRFFQIGEGVLSPGRQSDRCLHVRARMNAFISILLIISNRQEESQNFKMMRWHFDAKVILFNDFASRKPQFSDVQFSLLP